MNTTTLKSKVQTTREHPIMAKEDRLKGAEVGPHSRTHRDVNGLNLYCESNVRMIPKKNTD